MKQNDHITGMYQNLIKLQNQLEQLHQQLNGKAIETIVQQALKKKLYSNDLKQVINVFQKRIKEIKNEPQHVDNFEILDKLLDTAILAKMDNSSSAIYQRIEKIIHVLIKQKIME